MCEFERDTPCAPLKRLEERLDMHQQMLNQHSIDNDLLSRKIDSNSDKIDAIANLTLKLDETLKPIDEGVHAIQESVKVLGWIANIVKWISATVIGTGLVIYSWVEHIAHLFKGNH